MFAIIYETHNDGTLCSLPASIAYNHILRAVSIRNVNLAKKARRSVGLGPVNGRVVKAVAQNSADGITAFPELVGDIVTEVHDAVFREVVGQRYVVVFQPWSLG